MTKTILITGASTGFGRDTAVTLARGRSDILALGVGYLRMATFALWPGAAAFDPKNGGPHNNPVELVQRFYAALGRGDIPVVLALLDPDVEWTEAERFPYFGGTWHSAQAVVDNLLLPIARDWQDFSAKVDDFVAQDDRVVSFGTYSGTYRQTGRSMSAPFAHLWTVRDGRVSRFSMCTDTAKVLEALRPSPTFA